MGNLSNMINLYFGERLVGTLSKDGGTGIGKFVFENGVDSLYDMKHYDPLDDGFLEAVIRVFNSDYLRAVMQ